MKIETQENQDKDKIEVVIFARKGRMIIEVKRSMPLVDQESYIRKNRLWKNIIK